MKHLNETQRYTISQMRRDKKTQTEIAWAIGFSQAIVSKGLQRNRDSDGRYSAKMAQMFADTMKKRSHQPKISVNIIHKILKKRLDIYNMISFAGLSLQRELVFLERKTSLQTLFIYRNIYIYNIFR